ncbi:UDP-N-acetylglucosamine 2-epimerase [Leptospira kmetyi]|uniref:UDP-N-acetylglucosamine 2-epimerase n=1 Tax=Leptospira kmetyi TaxID=408139 RepID=UPI001082F562|nr:UDP-N-acetylglucosamine 2-epimerase [Leptospira kmetyi]TGK21434.1 UDP-N-acetylglucosamine 2-epimerase (hydrolyzing) [Leptospira kmetyi]TGK28361.1 UDP-N-acetylglucosamine 2-epimerase (hydrolyzing) [Leptospira kmetyi]
MKPKVCVVTGTRAEYGLLRFVMEGIKNSLSLELQIIATGSHLSPEFGLTYQEIEKDGFYIDRKVEMLLSSDSKTGVAKSIGLGTIGFADAFENLSPDLVMILGDRFELLSVASAALVSKIPMAHIHGGETTEGAFDEAIRHSLTKMSHIHFVAAEEYKKRVIQLGEDPQTVHLVGGLGLDGIHKIKLLDRKTLEKELGFELGKKALLVTFHTVTLGDSSSEFQMKELLSALDLNSDIQYIFTMPNADTDGRVIFRLIEDFVKTHPNSKAFTSLGQLKYLSALSHVDGVVGNSSSGIIEAPSFKKGSINIGDRQKGRIKATSVIDCDPERKSICRSINELYSEAFQTKILNVVNPYGDGGASEKIVRILENTESKYLLKKSFFDINFKY